MRAELVRIYKTVHTWTGLLCGTALFIAFYAGAITLFKAQLVHWATPPALESAAAQVPLAEAGTLITRTLQQHPEVAREFTLNLRPSADRLTWNVHEEDADEHDTLSVHGMVATLHDGSLEAAPSRRTKLGELIDVLHRVVGLPVDGDATRLFMGAVALLYFLALFSGLVTLLPSLVKDLFALRVGPNLKRMWLDAHNVVGLGSFPFHVVMALTASVFAFHDAIYAVQNSLIHDGKFGAMFGGRPGDDTPRDPAQLLPPLELAARVNAVAPGFEISSMRYMRALGPNPSVFVFGHDTRSLEQRVLGGVAIMEPYSGRIVSDGALPGHGGVAETMLTSFFALHFGSYGGKPVKVMYFALGLLGAWLVYSGNLLWIESRRKKARNGPNPAQRRDTRWLAAGTVGVCLGAVCGISLTIASAKWLHAVDDPNAWHRPLYYATFFASLGWALLRGAPRAAVELLYAACALTLAIPLTSLLALLPALGLWVHADAIGVDLVALALGLGFARIARATRQRIAHGPADSVWSLHTTASTGPIDDPALQGS